MSNLLKYAYQGSEVTFSNEENVMVNATQMAKPFGHGKEPSYWLSTQQAKSMLDAIAVSRNLETADLVVVKQGIRVTGTEYKAKTKGRWGLFNKPHRFAR